MPRVLVAEDSATIRGLIVKILTSDPSITVIGEAANGAQAVELCQQLRPDVVTMDIQMPVMDGVEAARRINLSSRTPVVMVSSLDPADVRKSMAAFTAGALAVIAKPVGPAGPTFDRACEELISIVKDLARVNEEVAVAAPPPEIVEQIWFSEPQPITIVGIVAGTGGPIALRTLFKTLPPSFDRPIFIVQQIAAGFAQGFADWLHEVSRRVVRLAVDREKIEPGMVYVAPDGRHLAVAGNRIGLSDAPPVKGARPSGTFLLSSLAKHYHAHSAGILLTGTGEDGVEGLRAIRAAGGAVFIQDKLSCASFAAPGAALSAGIAKKATPLANISSELVARVEAKSDDRL